MWFEGKSLKPYSEPISPVDLVPGETYFSLNFIDEEMEIPTLEPLVFIGNNLEFGDEENVYFQDAASYKQGIRYETPNAKDSAIFLTGSQSEMNHIFTYDQALDVLMACLLRRNKKRK